MSMSLGSWHLSRFPQVGSVCRPGAQRLTESLGPRALRIGLRTTLLAPLAAAASVGAIVEGDGPGLGSFLPLFLVLVAVGVVVAFLPWDRLHGTPSGRRILLVWAILDILLITVAGRATGAMGAALPLAYAVTFVFFAVEHSCPTRRSCASASCSCATAW